MQFLIFSFASSIECTKIRDLEYNQIIFPEQNLLFKTLFATLT